MKFIKKSVKFIGFILYVIVVVIFFILISPLMIYEAVRTSLELPS